MPPFVENPNILKSLRQPTEEFFKVFSILAAPLIVAFLAALFLWVPNQTREIYRVYARDLSLEQTSGWTFGQIECGLIGVLLTSFFNWQLARNLTLQFARSTLPENNVRGFALRWLPRLCGGLIPAGAAIGLLVASREVTAIPFDLMASQTAPKQQDASFILLVVGCVLMVFAGALVLYAYLRSVGPRNKYATAQKWLFSRWGIFSFVTLTIASIVLFSAPLVGVRSVKLAQFLGTPAIFFLFIIQLTYYASLLSAIKSRYGLPVLPLLAAWALGLAWLDINDNHFVAVRPVPERQAPLGVKDAFAKWYAARADLEFYQKAGKPYPVFLVSAAGGGLYAADFTATALGRLQDECPAFAQHAFAVSGVSGGGFGASLFATLVGPQTQIRTSDIPGADPCAARKAPAGGLGIESRAKLYLNGDFLAPIAGAGLFPDFVQRFLPFPIPALDRSRAFEASLDARWQSQNVGCEEGDCAPFAKPFLDHWRPDGVAPALVLNTTNVDIGYRTIVAPFIVAKDTSQNS